VGVEEELAVPAAAFWKRPIRGELASALDSRAKYSLTADT
jgi:hypothetical protein